jgi:hypothetical protein
MQKLQICLLGLPVHGASRMLISEASERNDPIEPCIRSGGDGAPKLAMEHRQSNASHAEALLPPRSLHDMSDMTFATMPLLVIRLQPIKSLVPNSSLGYRRTYRRHKC